MPAYCIMCGKPKSGIPIENDRVIDAIRWFKRNVTHDEQNNKLVVCKQDYLRYKKNRDRYTFRQAIYLGFGIIFALFIVAISSTSPTSSISSIFGSLLLGLGVIVFLYLMSLMNYTPKLHMEGKAITSKNQKHNQ